MKIIPAEQKHQKHMLGMLPYIIIYIYIQSSFLPWPSGVAKKVVSQCEGVLSSPELRISIPRRCSFLSHQDVSTCNMNTHIYIYIYVYYEIMTITNLLLLLHKHLLRNILSNYWLMWNASYVQKHFSKPDRSHWMIRSENLCEGYHTTRSDAAHSFSKDNGSSDCENRTKRNWTTNWSTCRFLAWPVAISEHWHRKNEAGTSRWSAVISACTVAASLDHRSQYMDGPPAVNVRVANCHDAKNPENQKPNKLQ